MNDEAQVSNGLTRRHVLVGGAALATATAFSALTPSAAEAAPIDVVEPLSIGYLEGSEDTPNLRRLYLTALRGERRQGMEEFRVVPASSLSGDPRLAGMAVKTTLFGLYPSKNLAAIALPAAIDVDVLSTHPFGEVKKPLRYFAWSFRNKPRNESPPVTFRSYADPDRGFGFEIRMRTAASPAALASMRLLGGSPEATPATTRIRRTSWFSMGRESNQPKLQRGIYLLSLLTGAWDHDVVLPVRTGRDGAQRLSLVLAVDSAVEPDA